MPVRSALPNPQRPGVRPILFHPRRPTAGSGVPKQRKDRCLPALASSLIRLELATSAPVIELRQCADIIRGDIGLVLHLLRSASHFESSDRIISIDELVVDAGVDGLRSLASGTTSSTHPSCEVRRLWMHSRLSAAIAEELASRVMTVEKHEGYIAGLLFHFGEILQLLGWEQKNLPVADVRDAISDTARMWGFPNILVDVIRGRRQSCSSAKGQDLLDIAVDASSWAHRLESLGSPMLSPAKPHIRLAHG